MTCFMKCSYPNLEIEGLDDSAVDAQHLAIDPGGIGTGEKGDDVGDVAGLPETLERRHLGEAIQHFLRFTLEKEIGGGGSGGHGIHRDVATAHFLGEHAG